MVERSPRRESSACLICGQHVLLALVTIPGLLLGVRTILAPASAASHEAARPPAAGATAPAAAPKKASAAPAQHKVRARGSPRRPAPHASASPAAEGLLPGRAPHAPAVAAAQSAPPPGWPPTPPPSPPPTSAPAPPPQPSTACGRVRRTLRPKLVNASDHLGGGAAWCASAAAGRLATACDLANLTAFALRCPPALPAVSVLDLLAGQRGRKGSPPMLRRHGTCAIVGSGGSLLGSGCGVHAVGLRPGTLLH